MENYFLKGFVPPAGVEFCELEVNGAGVVVDEENLGKIKTLMGLKVAKTTPTSIDGIVEVVLEQESAPALSKFSVSIVSWNSDGNRRADFQKAVEDILLPFVKKNVELYVPHKNTATPMADGKFRIFIWSSPKESTKKSPPEKIWNIVVNCRDEGFYPSGQGIPIVDTDTGWAVGELVGDNLFVHHDLCHRGMDDEVQIFRRLLEEVVMELSATPEQQAERQRELANVKRVASREAYIKECQRRFEKTVSGTREKVSTGHKDVERLQQELTKKIRETHGAERKLEQLLSCKGAEDNSYAKEFEALLAVPGVEDVQAGDGVIKVFTEHVYITPENCSDTYDIGKFRMEIYTTGSNGGIRFFNLTRQGTGGGHSDYNYNHPHVRKDGSPCLGNIKEMIPSLIAEYEFSAVAQIGLQYLKSVNTDDSAGGGIFNAWPKIKKEKKNEKEK